MNGIPKINTDKIESGDMALVAINSHLPEFFGIIDIILNPDDFDDEMDFCCTEFIPIWENFLIGFELTIATFVLPTLPTLEPKIADYKIPINLIGDCTCNTCKEITETLFVVNCIKTIYNKSI